MDLAINNKIICLQYPLSLSVSIIIQYNSHTQIIKWLPAHAVHKTDAKLHFNYGSNNKFFFFLQMQEMCGKKITVTRVTSYRRRSHSVWMYTNTLLSRLGKCKANRYVFFLFYFLQTKRPCRGVFNFVPLFSLLYIALFFLFKQIDG